MRLLIKCVFILLFSHSALAEKLQLSVLQVDSGSIVDLYGLPGDIELELQVDLILLPQGYNEFESTNFLFDIYNKDLFNRITLYKLPINNQQTSAHSNQIVFSTSGLMRQAHQLKNSAQMDDLFLMFSLVEKSKGRVCFFEKCNLNITELDVKALDQFRYKLIRNLLSEKNKLIYFSSEKSLFKKLSKDQLAAMNEKVLELWTSNHLVPIKHLLQSEVSHQLKESFWLENHQLSLFQYSIYGELKKLD